MWASAAWRERRDLYPEGVASGDPHPDSALLWTRRPPVNGDAARRLTVEVSEDERFTRVIATAHANLTPASDWTCRVLAAGLRPSHVYWYRFTDEHGNGSRVGRTITAPADTDARPVRFAFASCQNANLGAQNAYRRMIYEDERAQEHHRLEFVLHLGDFIYELVWYPEERQQGYYDRTIHDVVRYTHGEKITDFHIPTTVGDYRAAYRGYLHDPDLQDAAPAGHSSASGTTTSIRGRAIRVSRSSDGTSGPRRRARWPPIRPGGSTSRHARRSRAGRRSRRSIRRA